VTPSLATSTASLGNPSGAITRHVVWVATAEAVANGPRSDVLCEALSCSFLLSHRSYDRSSDHECLSHEWGTMSLR
jgi:hypothetical protein